MRGYHPLLAVGAGTRDVLMARLRESRATTARGTAHFLRETVEPEICGDLQHEGSIYRLGFLNLAVELPIANL